MTQLDHLVVTAPTLAIGVAWVEAQLGVSMQAGGEHAAMGTHNRLLRLGDCAYLEVIAVNPNAATPARPRWFGLDGLTPDIAPRLSTWVASCASIEVTAQASIMALGLITAMSRGALNWQISIPEDGKLIADGCAPALIEWSVDSLAGIHPTQQLIDVGCQLIGITLRHDVPQLIEAMLDSIQCDSAINVLRRKSAAEPAIEAVIKTPKGIRRLSL